MLANSMRDQLRSPRERNKKKATAMVADQLAPIGTSTWDTRCLVTCEKLNVTNMISFTLRSAVPIRAQSPRQ